MGKRQAELVREHLSWQEYGEGSLKLAELVADSGFRPDIILSIARVDLLGGALSYSPAGEERIPGQRRVLHGSRRTPGVPGPAPSTAQSGRPARRPGAGRRRLADTGRTPAMVTETCGSGVAEIRTAVLYEKPQSVVKCEYVWRRTDRWIEFPWSTQARVVR